MPSLRQKTLSRPMIIANTVLDDLAERCEAVSCFYWKNRLPLTDDAAGKNA